MKMESYVEEIKLQLTGGLLDLEVDDAKIAQVVNSALRETQRYIDNTRIITIPFASCIDLQALENDQHIKISSVSRVFRTSSYNAVGDGTESITTPSDPLYLSQIQMLTGNGGNIGLLNSYVNNYAAYNTLLQVKNTTSTDLLFKEDKLDKKLYINALDNPANITIEYVPRFDTVEEVTSDYWIDVIMRLSVALMKIGLGRIRSRYTQSNALWTQDGETLLSEGNEELSALREQLRVASQLTYPIDYRGLTTLFFLMVWR